MRLKTDHYVFLIVLVITALSILILLNNFTGFATIKSSDKTIKFSETIPPEIIDYECPLSFELSEPNKITGNAITGNMITGGFGMVTGMAVRSSPVCGDGICDYGEQTATTLYMSIGADPKYKCDKDCVNSGGSYVFDCVEDSGGVKVSRNCVGISGNNCPSNGISTSYYVNKNRLHCNSACRFSNCVFKCTGSFKVDITRNGALKSERIKSYYCADASTTTPSGPTGASEGGPCWKSLGDANFALGGTCKPGLICDYANPTADISDNTEYDVGICVSKICADVAGKVQIKSSNGLVVEEKDKRVCATISGYKNGVFRSNLQIVQEAFCAYDSNNQPKIGLRWKQDCTGPCRNGQCVCNENGRCDSGETPADCPNECEIPDKTCESNDLIILKDLAGNVLKTEAQRSCSGNNLVINSCGTTLKGNAQITQTTQNCPYGCDNTNLKCNSAPECEIKHSNYLARDAIFIDGTDTHVDITFCENGDFYKVECSTNVPLPQRAFPNAPNEKLKNSAKKVLNTDCPLDSSCHNIDGCRNICYIQNDKLFVKFNNGVVHEVGNVKSCENNQQIKELACKQNGVLPAEFNSFKVSYGSETSDKVGVKYTNCPNGCVNGDCVQVKKTCADYFNNPSEYSVLFPTHQGYTDNPQKQFDNAISFSYSVLDPVNPSQFYNFNNLKILIDNQEIILKNPIISSSRKRYEATNVNFNPNTAGKSTIKVYEGTNLCFQKEVSVGTYCGNNKKEWNEFCDGTNFGPSKPKCNDGNDLVTCNADCTLNFDACTPTAPTGYCGDGIIQSYLGEQCDNGKKETSKSLTEYNSNEPDFVCREDCTTRRCGDSVCDKLHGENAGSCPSDCANTCAQVFSRGDNDNLLFYPDPSGNAPDLMYHENPVDQETTITMSYSGIDHEKLTPANLFLKINGGSPMSGAGKNYRAFSMISFNNLNLEGRTSTVQLFTTGDVPCFPPKTVTVKNCAENFVNTQIDFTERQGTLPEGPQNKIKLVNPPGVSSNGLVGYSDKNLIFKIDSVEVTPDTYLEADITFKNKPSNVQVIDKNTNQVCKEIKSLNWFDTTAPPCNNNQFCDTEEKVGECTDCQPNTCRNHICEQGLSEDTDSYKETFETCPQDCQPACDTNTPCPVEGDVCCNNKCMSPPAEGQIIQNCKYVSLSTTIPVQQPAPEQPVYVAPEREYKVREVGVPVKHCPNMYTIPANKKFKLNYLNPTTYGERPTELERLNDQQLPVYVTCEGQENMDLISKGIKNIYSKEFRLALTQPVQCHVRVLDYRAIITVDPMATEISSRSISQEEISEIIGTQPTTQTQALPQPTTPVTPRAPLPAPTLPTPSVPVQQPTTSVTPRAPLPAPTLPTPSVPTPQPVPPMVTPTTPVQPSTELVYPTTPTVQNPIIYTSKPAKGKTMTVRIKSSSTKDEILVNVLSDASKYPKVMKAQKVEPGIYEIKVTPYTNREELT